MGKITVKRSFDMRIIGDWVEPGSRVLDLGCGRGDLLDYLVQAREVSAVGVDIDFGNVTACISRGVSAYQGDIAAFMRAFPERHFERPLTVEEIYREIVNLSENKLNVCCR